MPASMPPARSLVRRGRPSAPRAIPSWAAEPRRAAVANPSPTCTPLIAWMPISAPASRASRRRSQCTWEPRPIGTLYTSTSTTPPRVSPARWASSTSATIAAEVCGSRQRTGSASRRASASGAGDGGVSGRAASPKATVWETIRTPSSPRKARATVPRATRAAVSRAEARSRRGRASSKPYFCMPVRSAWPGRGRVSAALRARPSSSSAGTGSAAITFSHLGHSVLPTWIATGEPRVRPWRTPPRIVTASCSNFMRAPRPYPRRRRASASCTSCVVTGIPAGSPSTIPVSAGP